MLTAAGVEVLLKVKEQKLANPETLEMGSFARSNHLGKTVSCIGGQIVLNQPEYEGMSLEEVEQAVYEKTTFKVAAASILGFDIEVEKVDKTVDSLFYILFWPYPLRDRYSSLVKDCSSKPSDFAKLVAERIDLFIAEHYKEENTDNAE